MKNKFNNRKTLYLVLCMVLVSIFTLTIAYAALNTVLKITGNTEVVASSWDIYLDNPQVISGSATTTTPTITNKTTASFTTTLTNPGDYYMFTIDVVNNGSIDAMIDSIEKLPQLNETQAKYLNYIVEYQSGESINTKQLVDANSFVRLKVKVEFRKDLVASDLPTTSETLNLSFKVNYVQTDENNTTTIPNSGKLVKIVSGDYDTVGSEICIGEECFYVISSTENDVTMLAKYNLYVGGTYNKNTSSWTSYEEEATGMQDSTMKGFNYTESSYKGTTVFSNDSQKGTNYSDYNGSIVEVYVNNYEISIEKLGIDVISSRLITYDELKNKNIFNCTDHTSCYSSYPWVYSTSYWSSFKDNDYLWFVYSDGIFTRQYTDNSSFGVRPVITIPKSVF